MDASETGDDVFFAASNKLTTKTMTTLTTCTTHTSVRKPSRAAPKLSRRLNAPVEIPARRRLHLQPELFRTHAKPDLNGAGNIVGHPSQSESKPKRCTKGKVLKHGGCVRKETKKRKNGKKGKRARRSLTGKATKRSRR